MPFNLQTDGFAIVPRALSPGAVTTLQSATESLLDEGQAGARQLLDVPDVQDLATGSIVREAAEAVLGAGCVAVRALLFDKTPESNWRVVWHQDVTIAVKEQVEAEGFGPWSTKAGIAHVQAPAWLLEQMVAVRVHLDPCGPSNGPIRVLPGTHLLGKLDAAGIDAAVVAQAPVVCLVPEGGLLLMRPLLLHASSPAMEPGHRRVLHIEYAAATLPDPLAWYECHGAAELAGAH